MASVNDDNVVTANGIVTPKNFSFEINGLFYFFIFCDFVEGTKIFSLNFILPRLGQLSFFLKIYIVSS